MTYRVSLQRSATSLPTVWRPDIVSMSDDTELRVADGGFDPSETDVAAALDDRLATDTRVVLFTPLLDDYPAALTSALRGYGRSTAVLSPDVTGDEAPGLAVASLDRTRRRTELGRTGTVVADWTPERPLDDALERVLSDP